MKVTINIEAEKLEKLVSALYQAHRTMRTYASIVETERRDYAFSDELLEHAETLYDFASRIN